VVETPQVWQTLTNCEKNMNHFSICFHKICGNIVFQKENVFTHHGITELYVSPIHTEDEIDVLHNFILIFIFAVTICICRTFVIIFFFFALKLISMMHEIDAKKSQVHLNLNQKPELTKRLNLEYMLQPYVWSRTDKANGVQYLKNKVTFSEIFITF
jgi:hypothetical protein